MSDPNSNPKGPWGWLAAIVGLMVALATIVIYGEQVCAVFGWYWPPKIISVAADQPAHRGDAPRHLLAVKNPSIEEVVITGVRYRTEPTWNDVLADTATNAASTKQTNSSVTVLEPVVIRQSEPPPCAYGEFEQPLPEPISIEPKRTGQISLNLQPRNAMHSAGCIVSVALISDHGETNAESVRFSFDEPSRE